MSEQGASAASTRDLRLDFFRGLALFCIFVDHIPNNVFNNFTMQSLGLSDAAEMFILISGYTAGLVFGRALETRGPVAAGTRAYHRVWQLYVAHIFLFMLYMGMVAHTMGRLNNPIYAEELGAADFLREPDIAVVMAMTLQFQPMFLDILPLYIVLLAGLPVMLIFFRVSGIAALALSFALWVAVQFDSSIALPSYPGPSTWFFNPLAWQFLFFVGAYFGWKGAPDDRWQFPRGIVAVALIYAASAFIVKLSWTIHWIYDPIPAILLGPLDAWLSKTDLAPPRLLNILALAVIVMRFVGPRDRWLTHPAAAPFILCGRHSLHIFCLGILLSVLAHLVLNEYFGGLTMQAAVTAGGIAIMIAVAGLMDWFRKSQSANTATRARRTATLIVAAALLSLAPQMARAAESDCPVPDDAFEFEPTLPKTFAALEAGKGVTVVAIGGASSDGSAAGAGSAAWPERMGAALRERFSKADITIHNLSVPRKTTADMAKRFDRDVAPLKPDLVIWETGTTDAVRGLDPAEFHDDLEQGLEKLHATGSEVILMDMQYSRMTGAMINFNRYVVTMRAVADVDDIPLFPRHKIMRAWAEAGLFERTEKSADGRRALADKLYRCLGSAVAGFVARRPEPPKDESK
jgi:lysophospholipase L1-like esterase